MHENIMSPITHLFISWSVANSCTINKRDRALVTFAGIIPDIDGAGIILDFISHGPGEPLHWWSKYHHVLGHNIGFGLFLVLITLVVSTRRWITSCLVLLSFHLHLLCDLVGSKGPDGYQWPIPYLMPFSDAWQWVWTGQWELNAWPNILITTMTVFLVFYLAWKRGYSPLEMISTKANDAFLCTLRNRFDRPTGF
jgi:inner membrane protein